MLRALVCVFLLFFSAGCSMKQLVVSNMVPLLEDVEKSFNRERNAFAARQSAPAMLAQLDGFIQASPSNEELLIIGTKMHTSYAFGFLENVSPEDDRFDDYQAWARESYRKATEYGFRALRELDSDLAAILKDPKLGRDEVAAYLAKNGDADLHPYLFWLAFGWGSWINMNRKNADAVAELPKVEAIMGWCLKIDELYYFAGGHMFFGVRYAMRVGGDPSMSKKHFERALELTKGRFPLIHVLWAQKLAVSVQDRQAFESHLNEAIRVVEDFWERLAKAESTGVSGSNADIPEKEWALPMALAHEHATTLLDQVSDLFLGGGGD